METIARREMSSIAAVGIDVGDMAWDGHWKEVWHCAQGLEAVI